MNTNLLLNSRGALSFDEVMKMPDQNEIINIKNLQSQIKPESVCNIQITSGTTGPPKAALLTHFNYVNNSFFISYRNELYKKPHRCLVQMPFFHGYATVIILLAGLHNGTTHVVGGYGFKARESLDAIIKEKCNFLYGTPTMFIDLVDIVKKTMTKLEGVETAITGGASCPPQLFYDIKNTLGLNTIKVITNLLK